MTSSKRVLDSVKTGSGRALNSAATGSKKARDLADGLLSTTQGLLLSTTQGLLASKLASDLNDVLAGLAKGPATIYDKAMDAEYLATHIGGGSHRLFDGGHTIAGAFQAVPRRHPA